MVEIVGVPRLNDVLQLALTFGQRIKIRIRFGIGGVNLVELRERIHRFLHAFLYIATDIFGGVELRLLGQIPYFYS